MHTLPSPISRTRGFAYIQLLGWLFVAAFLIIVLSTRVADVQYADAPPPPEPTATPAPTPAPALPPAPTATPVPTPPPVAYPRSAQTRNPIKITLQYGSMTIPPGTNIELLGKSATGYRARYQGQEFEAPDSDVNP